MSDIKVDPFLAELREECLKDPEGRMNFLREAANEVIDQPGASLAKMIKICTEIENNFRSVGFVNCASLVGEFITQMRAISESYSELKDRASTDDAPVLQFFLTDVLQNFENYYESLKGSEDSDAKAAEYSPAVKILASWRPSAAASESGPSSNSTSTVEDAILPVLVEVPKVVNALPVAEVATVSGATNAAANLAAIVAATQDSSADKRHQYLICRGPVRQNQARVFAIPVQQVIEVIDRQPVSALPFPRTGLEGILNFRGDPLPVLVCYDRNDDGAKVDASLGKTYLVIANIEDRKFGFQMETVLSVTDLDPSRFESPGSWLQPQGATWVTHLVKQENEIILVMDLKKAVAA